MNKFTSKCAEDCAKKYRPRRVDGRCYRNICLVVKSNMYDKMWVEMSGCVLYRRPEVQRLKPMSAAVMLKHLL